jgi:hypothetical protein
MLHSVMSSKIGLVWIFQAAHGSFIILIWFHDLLGGCRGFAQDKRIVFTIYHSKQPADYFFL